MSSPEPPSAAGDRIAKVIARAGRASRREAERMIEAGRVAVNGKTIDSPALNVTDADRIAIDGQEIGPPDTPRLWLYHKPVGLVTTERDEKGRDTVFAALPEGMPRVVSVGRLDLNSEGLLLLTNDGGIKRKLELPQTGWLRKYRVRVHGTPEDKDLEPLRRGVTIDGDRFQPMEVHLDRQQGSNAWITIGLREGKNREIRRAMEVVGLPVTRLLRVSFGPFRLGDLKPGEVEEVKPRVLRDQLGLSTEGFAEKKAPKRGPGRKGPGSPGAGPTDRGPKGPGAKGPGTKGPGKGPAAKGSGAKGSGRGGPDAREPGTRGRGPKGRGTPPR